MKDVVQVTKFRLHQPCPSSSGSSSCRTQALCLPGYICCKSI